MFNLVRNEWMKLFHRAGTYVMLGLLVLGVVFATAFNIYLDSRASGEDWKETLAAENQVIQEEIDAGNADAGFYVPSAEGQMALNEYRVANDLPPDSETTVWSFLDDNVFLLDLIGLFAIIIASGIVASEFSTGTIKLLMIRPIKRWKILLSKFITVALFGFAFLLVSIVLSLIAGFIFFDTTAPVYLTYVDGAVKESSIFTVIAKNYLYGSIALMLLTAMAFMISAVFRNSSLAIGISIFLNFIGSTVTFLLSQYFDWAKYSMFANVDLAMYEMGMPLVDGMTMTFSVVMILLYFTVFMALAFTVFTKRDIAA